MRVLVCESGSNEEWQLVYSSIKRVREIVAGTRVSVVRKSEYES